MRHCGPELFEIDPLTSLDFAVEVERAGTNADADALAHELLLHFVGEELGTAFGLNTLDRGRYAGNNAVEKVSVLAAV